MANSSMTVAGLATAIYDAYNNLLEVTADPRTKGRFLQDGLAPLALILSCYYIFCTRLGPRLMRNRQRFVLKKAMFVYNLCNVLASMWVFNEGMQSGMWRGGEFNFICQNCDFSNSPTALRVSHAAWVYMMLKLFDLMDTVFFVLRKKDSQVTHLHLYHHSIMPFIGWIGARSLPGGNGAMAAVMNCFVHVVMYSYYLLAALGPKYQKYLWWKKYLTAMQLIQFVFIAAHQSLVFVYPCGYPKSMAMLLIANVAYFFILFGFFYVKTYLSKNTDKTTKKKKITCNKTE